MFVLRTIVQQPCQKICLELLSHKPAQNDVPANDSCKSYKNKQRNADYQKQITDFIFFPREILQFEGEHWEFEEINGVKIITALFSGTESAALRTMCDRIRDQASDIAEIIITEEKSEAQDIPKIIKMSEAAGKMVRDSVNAYVEKDLELSRKVIKDDDIVDELFEEVKTTLIDFIAENKGEQGGEAIDLIMVAKYLERIADHATNIAEWVEFSITGIHKASVV